MATELDTALLQLDLDLVKPIEPNGMQNHMKYIIFYWFAMPKKMLLQSLHTRLHRNISFHGIAKRISFKFGISFSATITEKALQSSTSSKGGTKLSAMITGTHS
ncbi:LOW QUALITY PROTEIN: uncharacterized protein LOC131253079 [Magnolia sinica]|uniref:LOW QUALITY PROTEIN: uncharacterized protein LOC131253079 n=1 Tax=Magnolia sinica TaxID=86752 RepID=UPI00265937EE|nr:LOW QUALITY PROTEIN: uncharacterized protein LOC131253079 [Magnolia sinica]